MDLFKGMKMRHIGPGTMSGRVTCIDVVNEEPNVIFVGTASGGLWKSESAGMDWEPIFDDQPVQSIGAIAIDQNNPDVIWAGTGEGNPRNSHTSGAGIFRSLDGGHSWEYMGLKETKLIHRVIIHRDNPEIVFVAALGSAWGENSERGVFRTTDGGKTWEKILYVNDSTGCADMVVDPTNPNKLMVAMWEFGRKPYTFNSGGEGSGLYVTHDGGDSWRKKTEDDGLPKGNLGRMGLAIAASNPDVCYALIESSEIALYKSTNGGIDWKKISTDNVGNRPFYYADIYVNPSDENQVWSLWSMVSRSGDGGRTFQTVIPYSGVHPDHHAFWISPTDPNYMMDGNDGGFNISRDGGSTWQFISNLPLGQFYHINYDMDIPYHVYGGMQDNGSWQGPAYTWQGGGIKNHQWKEISFGDGFDVVPYQNDSRYAFSMWQGGNLLKTDIETGQSTYIRPYQPDSVKLRFNWNAAIAQDPFKPCGLFFGSQYVHYTEDCGLSWEVLSPDLTTNDTLKQKQAESGGLTKDVTDAENYTTIVCIAPNPRDAKEIWVGTDDGNIQLTRNRGESWNNLIGNIKGYPDNPWVTQIHPSKYQDGEAFVVVNNYRQNDWKPYLYYTADYGSKWTNLVAESQVSGHCLSFVQDHKDENLMFLGTENGLFVSFDKGANWNHWTHDYPTVSTMDMHIHPRENDLILGTFGRAAYILDDISPLREYAEKSYNTSRDTLKILSAPTAYLASYSRPAGARFAADMEWRGENRWSGSRIAYHIVLPEAELEKDSPEAKIDVYVLDQRGDSLRHFKTKTDTSGVHVMRWGLDTKGVHWPSRRERKKNGDQPGGGMQVPPGTYKVVLAYGDHKDSVDVVVKGDPRLNFSQAAYDDQVAMQKRWESSVSKADAGFEQTKKALKTIKKTKSQLELVPDSLKKDVIAMADSLQKEIKKLQNLYMLPEGTTGYHDESELLSSYLWGARSYIDTGNDSPGSNSDRALELLEQKTDEVVAQINALFSGDWLIWKAKVEEIEYTLFEEFEPIE